MQRGLGICFFVVLTKVYHMNTVPILPKLCEHFSYAPNCRNNANNVSPKVQSSSLNDTTYNRNLTSPNVSGALADPKPVPVIAPSSPSDIFSEAQKKLDNRPKTSIESADTVFASCDDASLVFGYYCGDDPETQSLKDKCQSYIQRCNITNRSNLKQPECEKDFNQYYFSCTHNALPSVENQQYCENYWTFCRYILEQKLGVQDASIYRAGRKYYANTFCQRYKLMGTLYCPTLQTSSLRQDCNFYRMYCRGQNATVQNLTYVDNFPLAEFLNPYHSAADLNATNRLISPRQYVDKILDSQIFVCTWVRFIREVQKNSGWNSNLAGITDYSGKTNVLLSGVINPVHLTDQDVGPNPFDVANTKSLYEIPVAYTNFFMPWINGGSTNGSAPIRNGTIFRT